MTTSPSVGRISSHWGKRKSLVPGMSTFHKGTDIVVPVGSSVVAPLPGIVIESKYNVARGHYIIVDHGEFETLSQHLSKRLVSVGQRVSEGQLLALSGNTGTTTAPHNHTEVRHQGTPIDPEPWYAARGVTLGTNIRVPGSRVITSREDNLMYILVCHDGRRGYWLVGPGHAHQFNQNPDYREEYDEFRARFPEIPVKEYPAGDAGVRDFDQDKGVFTQARL